MATLTFIQLRLKIYGKCLDQNVNALASMIPIDEHIIHFCYDVFVTLSIRIGISIQ